MLLALLGCSALSQRYAASNLEPGTTMFGLSYPANAQQILHVDVKGEVLWSYTLPYGVFMQQGQLGPSMLMDVEPLESGNVLFTVFPGGVYEVDREGRIVWYYLDDVASHDSDRLDNGNTLIARTWAKKGDFQVIEVDADRKVVWGWVGAGFGEDERFVSISDEGDAWMHITNVDRTPDGLTRVCVRNFNAIVTISPEGEVVDEFFLQTLPKTTVAETTGTLVGERPHAAEWLDDGRFLLATRRPDKIVEIGDGEVTWRFKDPTVASVRDLDRLPGGNTLIAARDRIIEVDPGGTVLWQWTIPNPPDWTVSWNQLHPLMSVTRVAPDGTFVDRD